MVTLLLDRARLEVVLSLAERLFAAHGPHIQIDRSDIAKVQITDDPWTWIRGLRAPGTHLPGVLAAGTWRVKGGKDFVWVRGRRAGVVIDLAADAPYQRLILTTRHAEELVRALGHDAGSSPVDVVQLAQRGPSAT